MSEKHEMIMHEHERIDNHSHQKCEEDIRELYRLVSEKHEMIMHEHERIDNHSYLFSEKHEMIMADRKEIAALSKFALLGYWEPRQKNRDEEMVIDFLKNHELQMYPYEWTDEYKKLEIEIKEDEDWLYVMHRGKPMYFPRRFTADMAREYYRFLLMEQDERSPHRYFTEEFCVENAVGPWIDCGAAEGMITLEHVENFENAYLIENDIGWVEALRKTFANYKNVTVIDKFLCDYDSDKTLKLDSIIEDGKRCVIKMDIEGSELDALSGLTAKRLRVGSMLAVCAYHRQTDLENIIDYMKENSITYTVSDGFILSTWGGYKEPFLRRGMVRAIV